jgi:hypothetical protein
MLDMTTYIATIDQFKDYCPINSWQLDDSGKTWLWEDMGIPGEPKYLIDKTTRRYYFNVSKDIIRCTCFILAIATPIIHAVTEVANVAYRAIRLLSLYHFWKDTKQSQRGRMTDAGYDLLRLVSAPIAYVGLELAAIYGIFNPYDGRKLYSTLERQTYEGQFALAKCFKSKTSEEREIAHRAAQEKSTVAI